MSAEATSQFMERLTSKTTQCCFSDTEEYLMCFEGL